MHLVLLQASTDGSLLTAWSFEPLIAAPLLWCAMGYGWALRRVRRNDKVSWPWTRPVAFYGGLLALWIALLGPPGTWNDELFFLHMLQHLLLMMVAAPLLLVGRPVQLFLRAIRPATIGRVTRPILRRGGFRTLLTAVTHPLTVLVLFNINLVVWHLPRFYERALADPLVHELEHAAFLSTALLFWWILIDPVPSHHRAPVHWLLAMSFVSCMVGALLGAALTLAPDVIYTHYQVTDHPLGISPLADQHIGGALMWASGAVYFAIMFGALYKMVQPSIEPPSSSSIKATVG